MIRGRKPKPTHLKLVQGNPGRRPIEPDKIQPPERSKALAPPACLGATAKAEWRRLAPVLHKLGLLSDMDRGVFTAYCEAWGRWRDAERKLQELRKQSDSGDVMVIKTQAGNYIQNPYLGIANKAMNDMVRHAAEFGLSPSARARVHDNAPKGVQNAPGGFFDD